MDKFESLHPHSLFELSDTEIDNLSSLEQDELIELVISEDIERLKAIGIEINRMNEDYFSLDALFEIRSILEEYQEVLTALNINNQEINNLINELFLSLEKKNPLSSVATNDNGGNVLVHTSRLNDCETLLSLSGADVHASEVCTTAGTLRQQTDLFRSKVRPTDVGVIFNVADATHFFSRDVGSHYRDGKRVLEDRMRKYLCLSLDEAKARRAKRIEAWVDTQSTPPSALLVINPEQTDSIKELGRRFNLPVLYNSNLF